MIIKKIFTSAVLFALSISCFSMDNSETTDCITEGIMMPAEIFESTIQDIASKAAQKGMKEGILIATPKSSWLGYFCNRYVIVGGSAIGLVITLFKYFNFATKKDLDESNERVQNASVDSPLSRCELILTDVCNFQCLYCRGLRDDLQGTMPFEQAEKTLRLWIDQGLKNIRFSGGEPTLYREGLDKLVAQAKAGGVERIAISTNGSNRLSFYKRLIELGVDDFSISLDSASYELGNRMSGGRKVWDKVVSNIKELSKLTLVTVGMVFTEENVDNCMESVFFADSLGVSDIRVIPSAQYNQALEILQNLPNNLLIKYPILKYRINNLRQGISVRGIDPHCWNRCWLVLDDMVVVSGFHFPCIIYMREQGNPIGKVSEKMRQERADWIENHEPWNDPICSEMCLDVCIDYNKTYKTLRMDLK